MLLIVDVEDVDCIAIRNLDDLAGEGVGGGEDQLTGMMVQISQVVAREFK